MKYYAIIDKKINEVLGVVKIESDKKCELEEITKDLYFELEDQMRGDSEWN